jgi:uncharacterized protein with HEPN domain
MRKRLSRPALQAILASIEGIEDSIRDKSLDEFAGDWAVKHAVQCGIEIISEASRRLPQSLRDQRPEIPWKAVMGIGNILRHDYDAIVDEVIYGAATTQLALLKVAIISIEANLKE